MCADDADVLAVEGEPDGRHRRAAVRHDGSEIGECLLRGDEIEERGNPGNGWRCGMKVYAFDVDHTLELSAGPVGGSARAEAARRIVRQRNVNVAVNCLSR